jgi:hypothetical protein
MLLPHIIQRTTTPQFCIFWKSITIHHLYCPTASGASVNPKSQVHSSTTLVLPLVGNLKARFLGRLQWNNVHTKFYRNLSSNSWDKLCSRQTDMTSPICVHCMHIMQRKYTNWPSVVGHKRWIFALSKFVGTVWKQHGDRSTQFCNFPVTPEN